MHTWIAKAIMIMRLCGVSAVLIILIGCTYQSSNPELAASAVAETSPANLTKDSAIESGGESSDKSVIDVTVAPTSSPVVIIDAPTATPSPTSTSVQQTSIKTRLIASVAPEIVTQGDTVILHAAFIANIGFVRPEVQYPGADEPIVLEDKLANYRGVFWECEVPAGTNEGEAKIVVKGASANFVTDEYGRFTVDFDNPPLSEDWVFDDTVTFTVTRE